MANRTNNLKRNAQRRLTLDALEPRLTLDASGVATGLAPYLSLSFTPDGTDVGGAASSMLAKFDAMAPRAEWQAAILRAFQTWAVHTNGDVGVVADGGQPLGTPGATQRDDRFGDI